MYAAQQIYNQHRCTHSDAAAQQSEKRALQKKLKEDTALGCPEGLTQADFACALRYRDQQKRTLGSLRARDLIEEGRRF